MESPPIVQDTGLRTAAVGTATTTGDGETTEFVLPHDLDGAPSVRNVWPENSAVTGFHVARADSEAVVVAFDDSPAENAPLYWGFEGRR